MPPERESPDSRVRSADRPASGRGPRQVVLRWAAVAVVVLLVLAVAAEVGVRAMKRRRDRIAAEQLPRLREQIQAGQTRLGDEVAKAVGEGVGKAIASRIVERSVRQLLATSQPASRPGGAGMALAIGGDAVIATVDLCGRTLRGVRDDEPFLAAADGLGAVSLAFHYAPAEASSQPSTRPTRLRAERPTVTIEGPQEAAAHGVSVRLAQAEANIRDADGSRQAASVGFALRLTLEVADSGEVKTMVYDGIQGWVHASGLLGWCHAARPDGEIVWETAIVP